MGLTPAPLRINNENLQTCVHQLFLGGDCHLERNLTLASELRGMWTSSLRSRCRTSWAVLVALVAGLKAGSPFVCSDFAELHKRGPVEASLVCQLSKVLL